MIQFPCYTVECSSKSMFYNVILLLEIDMGLEACASEDKAKGTFSGKAFLWTTELIISKPTRRRLRILLIYYFHNPLVKGEVE